MFQACYCPLWDNTTYYSVTSGRYKHSDINQQCVEEGQCCDFKQNFNVKKEVWCSVITPVIIAGPLQLSWKYSF